MNFPDKHEGQILKVIILKLLLKFGLAFLQIFVKIFYRTNRY